jgi:hypothetical protein
MENSKRVFEKILLERTYTNRVIDTSHLLSAMLAKKKPKITYGSRVEVKAYIHWAEDPVVLRFVL